VKISNRKQNHKSHHKENYKKTRPPHSIELELSVADHKNPQNSKKDDKESSNNNSRHVKYVFHRHRAAEMGRNNRTLFLSVPEK
jgi:hypothetical protein